MSNRLVSDGNGRQPVEVAEVDSVTMPYYLLLCDVLLRNKSITHSLGSLMVACRSGDREVAGSTPGRSTAS